jgi:parallel beta-helix repeat protein
MLQNSKKNVLFSGFIVFYFIALGLIGIFVFEGLLNTENVLGATIFVDKNGNGDYSTIQEAIDNATAGDTIRVWDGVYNETLEIYFNIKLIGNGSENTTIDASESWWEAPINIYSNYVDISGFNIKNGPWDGIYISFCSYVNIFNNTISNNYYGLEMVFSSNIMIKNNSFINNAVSIMSNECDLSNIVNNTITECEEDGIILDCSKQITLLENKLDGCGITIRSTSWGDYFSHWTTHNIDKTNTINGKPLIYWKNKNNVNIPAGASQIILANCTNIIIDSQNCSNTSNGVLIGLSSKITIKNGIFSNNFNGINIQKSDNITIINNNISYNRNNGINLEESSWNDITNNYIGSNSYHGISLDWLCNKNIIMNNTCNINRDCGLFLSFSNNNTITQNKFNFNWNCGLFLGWQSRDMEITKNEMCNNNFSGIILAAASNNKFSTNNVSNNDFGIQLTWDCNRNQIEGNIIGFNRDTGVELGSSCSFNKVYHNNFVLNKKQALDINGTTNSWSKNNEGNYWSDYIGEDDGSSGRFCGDLIGDTDIPHPDEAYDNYPFIIYNGWLYPGTPLIHKPVEIDSDGNYNITWGFNFKALGYILEEDDNVTFDSPTVIFDGIGIDHEIKNKPEGKYFYRLKLYNDHYSSEWSSIVNVTVDYLPEIPADFKLTAFPPGNALNISWVPNAIDTECYELYYRTDGMNEFALLVNITHPGDSYSHTNLIDGQTYYYKMRTKDRFWQESTFSSVISAVPRDSIPPDAPNLHSAEAVSDSKIKLTWVANDDADLDGYQIYMHDPTQNLEDMFELKYTLPTTNTTCIVSGLKEQVNYLFKLLAFDEVPNNSSFSNVLNATTPDETHPQPPTDLEISNITYHSLTLSWKRGIDLDIIGYIIYRSNSLSSDFQKITEIISDAFYIDKDLNEETLYYYKVQSIDDAGLVSILSEPTFGFTILGPKPPEVSEKVLDFELEEDAIDNTTISLYKWFTDVNDDPLTFGFEGNEHIDVTINQVNGQVILKPKENWNGVEHLTFFASDGTFEINDTVTVTITPVNDAPKNVEIVKPSNGLEFRYNQEVHFEGRCTDPDLPYGDELTFTWLSNVAGSLGTGSNLTGIILEPGAHSITLEVTDKSGEKSETSINITILEKKTTKDDDSKFNDSLIYAASVLFVVILILCILFLVYRNKRKPVSEKSDLEKPEELEEPEKTQNVENNEE